MREIHLTLVAADGHPLAATAFEPAGRPVAAVQINGATGVPRRYYRAYAEFLAAQGFAVLTYDYRGIGGSRYRGHEDRVRMSRWGSHDLAAGLDWLDRQYPQLPVLAVGHSAGGQLLGLAANNRRVAAALSIASQSGYWGLWPRTLQPVMAALWYAVLPATSTLLGRIPAGLMGAELPAGVADEWARWCRSPHYVSDPSGQPIREHFHAYRGRMRFYAIGDDDFYAPQAAVAALAGFYRRAQTEVLRIEPSEHGLSRIGHFGFFRSGMPAALWQQTADWLFDAARPALRQAA